MSHAVFVLEVATFSSSPNSLSGIPLAFCSQCFESSAALGPSAESHKLLITVHKHANHSAFTTQKCTVEKCAWVYCTCISQRHRCTAVVVTGWWMWSLQWSWTRTYSMIWEHADIQSDQTKSPQSTKHAAMESFSTGMWLIRVPSMIGCMQSREPEWGSVRHIQTDWIPCQENFLVFPLCLL